MPGGPQHRRSPRELALGVDELLRCQQLATTIALVSLGILQCHLHTMEVTALTRGSLLLAFLQEISQGAQATRKDLHMANATASHRTLQTDGIMHVRTS